MGYDNVNFPAGTTFLVTGAAGFIGSNLVEALLKLGMKVRGLDNLSTGKIENIDDFKNHPDFQFIEGDIRDLDTCISACGGIDYVLHQAALGSVPRSVEYPLLYEENNIKGTLNMMEAARQAKVKRFVYASSSSVYGDSEKLPKVEGEEGKPLSPYAVTKVVNELYGSNYTRLYGLECIGLRYFNIFGRRQDPNSQYAAVIPLFFKQLLAHQPPTVNGDGEQSRDFTYIDNAIEANIKACLAPPKACGRAFNIACGVRLTINEIYKIMCHLTGIQIAPLHSPARLGDVKHSLADISKARQYLAYDPLWTFERGLKNSEKWYREYLVIPSNLVDRKGVSF